MTEQVFLFHLDYEQVLYHFTYQRFLCLINCEQMLYHFAWKPTQ